MSAPTPEPGAGETPCAECGWPKSDVWHDEEKRPRLGLPYHPFARALATPSPAAQGPRDPDAFDSCECGGNIGPRTRRCLVCGKYAAAQPRATPDLDALHDTDVEGLCADIRTSMNADDRQTRRERDTGDKALCKLATLAEALLHERAALLDRVTRVEEERAALFAALCTCGGGPPSTLPHLSYCEALEALDAARSSHPVEPT